MQLSCILLGSRYVDKLLIIFTVVPLCIQPKNNENNTTSYILTAGFPCTSFCANCESFLLCAWDEERKNLLPFCSCSEREKKNGKELCFVRNKYEIGTCQVVALFCLCSPRAFRAVINF